jgi:hypothetical protein
MENKDDETIYQEIVSAKVSQSCQSAFEDYCLLVIPICPQRPNIARSLLRVAIRPLFYLGYCESQIVIEILKSREIAGLFDRENMNSIYTEFLIWMTEHSDLIDLCVKDLKLCCFLYDLYYDEVKNKVILNHKLKKDMETVFFGVADIEIYKEFSVFEEFKIFFLHLFHENGLVLNDEERNRIITEERIEKEYFSKIRENME